MFWKKKKKSPESKHVALIDTHLSGGMPMIQDELASPATRVAVQIFILGMADMVRETESLLWDEYVLMCENIFENHDIAPSEGAKKFIEKVARAVGEKEEVAKLLRFGTQSIEMYVSEGDANAPTDLLSIPIFAQNNASKLSGII